MGRSGVPWEGGTPYWSQGPYPYRRQGTYEPLTTTVPRRPRRLRATLLLVTAFVATVTAVISGVRVIADLNRPAGAPSDLGDVPPCPPSSDCAALFPPRATPTGTGTPVPTGEPTGEPTGGASAAPSGSPAPPGTAEPPTPVPSPSGSRTATARPSSKPSPTGTARDPGVRLRPSPSPTPPRTASPSPRPTDPEPEPEPTRTERAPLQAVVKFIVLGERDGRYSAEIAIGNDGSGDLNGWEISLPIDGRVLAVDGARAVRRGDTLVLRSAEVVPSGGGVAVRVVVRGEPVEPEFCLLRGGNCRILPDRG